MMKAKAYTDTASTMPLPPIPPFSSSSSLMAEAAATNTTSSKKRVRQMGHSNCESPKIERERRSKMTQMFTQLRTTVPGVFPQATREVIINETIQYIKDLEKKKQRLEQIKESMKLTKEEEEGSKSKVPCSSNNMNCSVSVNVSSNVAFFGIQSLARPGFITLIFRVFFKHQAQILAANVSVHDGNLILAITANLVQNGADGNAAIENIKREIMAL